MVDTKEDKLAALVDVGKTPHPGRGANFTHPKYGPVWATSHLGAEDVTLIGTDPVTSHTPGRPSKCSRPGRRLAVYQDPPEIQQFVGGHPLNPDAKMSQSVAVFDIKT